MKRRIVWLILSFLIVLSLVLASCAEAVEEEEEEEEEEYVNWWDKFGEPEYGGTVTIREGDLSGYSFDPSNPYGGQYTSFWFEALFQPDWSVDRDIWPFNMGFTPVEYMAGALAESWEQTDPLTWTVHLRQGIHFQDKPPLNGRELTADDVQYSYDWLLGTGSGFTEPNVFWAAALANIERVVATDKYTVEFRLKEPGAMSIYQIVEGSISRAAPIIAREWLEQGDIDNWENAVGTGPWMLTDVLRGSSMTFSRNPNYWGYDERHPQNQLPYLDTYKAIAIPDLATAMASLRTAKVDLIVQTRGGLSWQQGANLANTNPEIEQALPPNPGYSVDMRCDTEPFTDIKVRKALQMAIDRETIAKVHYGGTVDGTPCGVTNPAIKGWCTPYDEWPVELQEEYSFNPERARELLAEAGYPNGFKTNCMAGTEDDLDLLQIIKDEFLDIGVDMEIKAMEGATLRGLVQAGDYDAMVFTNGTAMPFGPDWCIRFRESVNTRDNYTRNNDPKYDAMIKAYDAATTLEEAQRISVEADRYLLEQHWSVQTFPTAIAFAWQPYVKGYTGEILIGSSWLNFIPTRLWVDQDLKESMGH